MTTFFRWALYLIGSAVALVLVLGFAGISWLRSETGAGWLSATIVEAAASPDLSIKLDGLSGELPLHWRLHQVTLTDRNGPWLRLGDVALDLDGSALLGATLRIANISAAEIDVLRSPAAAPAAPATAAPAPASAGFKMPVLPVALDLGRLAVTRLVIDPSLAGEKLALSLDASASLHQAIGHVALKLARLDGGTGAASLALDYQPGGGKPDVLQLEFHAEEPSGDLLAGLLPDHQRRPLVINLGGAGSFDDWRGRIGIAAGTDARLDTDLAIGLARGTLSLGIKGNAVPATLLAEALRPVIGPQLSFDIAAHLPGEGPMLIDHADLAMAAAKLSAKGKFDTTSGPATDLTLGADLVLAPLSGLAGRDLAGQSHLEATLTGALAQPHLVASLTGGGIAAGEFGVKALNAAIDLAPASGNRLHLTGQGRFDGVSDSAAAVPAGLGDGIAWSIDTTTDRAGSAIDLTGIKVTGAGLDLAANATLDRGKLTAKASLIAADLSRFAGLVGKPIAGNLHLAIDANTEADAALSAQVTGQADGLRSGIPAVDALLGPHVALAAHGGRDAAGTLRLDQLTLTGAAMALDGSGRADSGTNTVTGQIALDLPRLQALGSALATPMAGTLRLVANLGGALDNPALDAKLTGAAVQFGKTRFDRLDAAVKTEPLSAKRAHLTAQVVSGSVTGTLAAALSQPSADMIEIRDLALTGPATKAAGNLTYHLNTALAAGTLTAECGDLSAWSALTGEALAGRFLLNTKFTDVKGQGVTAHAEAGGIAYGTGARQIRLQQITLSADLSDILGKQPRGTVSLDLAKFVTPGARVDLVKLQAASDASGGFGFTGSTAGNANAQDFTTNLAGRLALQGNEQSLSLTRLDGAFGGLKFRQSQVLAATKRGDALNLTGLALSLDAGKLSGAASYDGKTVSAKLTGTALPLSRFAELAQRPEIIGSLGFDLALSGSVEAPRGHLTLQASGLKLAATTHPDLPALDLSVNGDLQPERLALTGRIDGPKNQSLKFSAGLPVTFDASGTPSLPPDGALQAKLQGGGQIAALSELLPLGEDKATGLLTIDLSVGGTVGHPQAGGRLLLTDGHYLNDASGLVLDGIDLEVVGDQQAFVIKRFAANDHGKGRLGIAGRVDLAASGGPSLDVTATMKSFTVAARDEATAIASADVHVVGAVAAPEITGVITIDRAEIFLPNQLPPSVASLNVQRIDSSEVKISGKAGQPGPAAAPAPGFLAALDMKLHAPGQIFVRGQGLDSEWRGDLAITGTSAAPSVVGDFTTLNGTLSILGKDFTLQRGIINFDGGTKIDPRLDILAQTQTSDVTAQILIQGSPSQPTLKLTSVPELPQDEVLSRVLFGSNIGQITPTQGLELAQAAASLAGGGGPGMLDKLRSFTGLDRLSVGSSQDPTAPNVLPTLDPNSTKTTSTTAVTGGKYVAPGVFVGVDQGASGTSTKARVEIDLMKHLTLGATAGAASAASSVGLTYRMDY